MTNLPTHQVIKPKMLYAGTPVYLISTLDQSGAVNLAPASSYWALGETIVLGLEVGGQTINNILQGSDLTVNFATAQLWQNVEALATSTGANPVPEFKTPRYHFEGDKFSASSLTAQPSDLVAPPRVIQSPLQLEAKVLDATLSHDKNFYIVQAQVVRVHAHESIVVPGTEHINPATWRPLIYNFKHFYDLGEQVGWTVSSPTSPANLATVQKK